MPKTLWVDQNINEQVSSSGNNLETLMPQADDVLTRFTGLTLLRTIIGLDVAHLIHDSGEGSQRVFMAIGIATQEAFTLGFTALPEPANVEQFPTRGWIWKHVCRTYGFAADQPAVFNRRVDLDLRSQRRIQNGELMFIANNNPEEGVATTVLVSGLIRTLFLVS